MTISKKNLTCAVETSTPLASVSVLDGDVVVAMRERRADHAGHGGSIVALIDGALADAKTNAREIARWVVDVGPGSFTGVRVGVATVKGIAFATGAAIVGVNAFDALAASTSESGTVVALLAAGKGELYYRIAPSLVGHATAAHVSTLLRDLPNVILVGEAATTIALDGIAARILSVAPHDVPRAEWLARAALGRSDGDLDSLEPYYVRAPDLTKSSS